MKHTPTLLLFLLSLSCVVQGQKKDTTKPKFDEPAISVHGTTGGSYPTFVFDRRPQNFEYIYMDTDSTIKIHGDTLGILRKLFRQHDSLSRADYEFVKIAVDFANTVPEYFKKGKAWNNFLAEIRRRGHRVSKKN